MSDDAVARADRILDEALAREGAQDPRDFYRERLREIKSTDNEAYERAVAYYTDTLIPSVAACDGDPLTAWTEYGRRLAEAAAPGRTVSVDRSGRAEPYRSPVRRDRLVLHLPDAKNSRALPVGLPADLSEAQQATYDVLVSRRTRLRE